MTNWRPPNLEELSQDTQKVYDILNKESDIACVLIGTSFLANLIASTLKEHFIKSTVSDKLLDPQRGAIGNFAVRSDLLYCLGLIDKNVYQDLSKIAEIRNYLAHGHLAIDFGDSTIKKYCSELKAWRVLLFGEKEIPASDADTLPKQKIIARNQFNLSIVMLSSRIHLNALGQRNAKMK